MRFMFYRYGFSPIEESGIFNLPDGTALVRPVPRIGERVTLDAENFIVEDVTHVVQRGAEVRIFVKAVG